MSYKTSRFYLVMSLLFTVTSIYAQDPIGTEVINVVKPYTPTVSDAFKIKETPNMQDSQNEEKKEVQYSIFSVPVASTFTPAKGKATTVERKRPEKIFTNYATLGFGSYTSVLGEFYSRFEVNRDDQVELFFKHNSSQGGIDEVLLDDYFYNTALDVNYKSNGRFMNYTFGAGILHQTYNWYGLSPEFRAENQVQIVEDAGVNHSFYGLALNGNFKMQDSPFSGGDVLLRYFGDSYSSSEINFIAKPEFLFDLGGQDVGVNVDVNYLNGSFDKSFFDPQNDIKYSYLNAGLHPFIKFQNDDFSVNLGAQVVFGLDTENSESDVFIYPKVTTSYKLVDEYLTLYAGADGGLDQNSYYDFSQINPFVSPTLFVAPTDRQYEGFAGVKGKFTNAVSYNLRGSYTSEINKPLFLSNPLISVSQNPEGYEFGNSFGVIYDDVNTLEVFGELQAEVTTNVTVGVNASFFNYSLDFQPDAYNLPELKATVFANAAFTEKIYGGLSLFYVGERKDLISFDPLLPVQPIEKTLDGYVDLNLHAGYHINPQLTVFLKGSNLLSDTYEKWLNTPVQGIQVLGGATYKFDW
ncbi:MAG: TonB-dependent receptor [Flavobacteriaceae bacterium]|nr:TonB-dependent receptor [Flavobacteriaceae bacterium]